MLEAFGLSDPGCVRPNNEDYFICDAESGIFVLADGMGGANAGEFASRLSAERLYEILLRPSSPGGTSVLEQAFDEANSAVRRSAQSNPSLVGMGTTLLAARSVGNGRFELGSVGDSRAYHVSSGSLTLVTEDQTWVAEVGPQLGLSDEVLKKHPLRHVLTMAIGSTDQLRVYTRVIELAEGDQLLLCSDGLHGLLNEKSLCETLKADKPLPEKCRDLIDAAKSAGGTDNVTAVLIQVT